MRTKMRLLLVGVLLCIGLQVGKVELVQAASGDLVRGKYEGFLDLHARQVTSAKGQLGPGTYTKDAELFWNTEALLDLEVIDKKTAFLTMRGNELTSHTRLGAAGDFEVNGFNCAWSVWMEGDGSFQALYLRPLNGAGNFDGYSYFELPLRWTGKTTWDIVQGSAAGNAPNCTQHWNDELAEIEQQKGINEASKQIKKILFKIVTAGPNLIDGDCSLPDWEGTGDIEGGTVEREITICDWRVFKPGSKEWKEWGK